MSQVVIAPDKFKGTLTAPQVAAHVAAGLKRARPGTETIQVPIADGGDGTVDAAEAAGYRKIEIGVRGPTGRPVTAAFAFSDGTAVIEAAQACGLSRLPGGALAPLTASSRGVGELILAAARMRAKRIVLGLGGVATTDGGSGMVRAFGAKLVDEADAELPPGGAALARLHQLDLRKMRDLSGVEFIVASDVNNPLLGEKGAAAVYAPQKGASPEDVVFLEEGLTHWADAVEQALGTTHRDAPGAGAAGGLGFAALAFLRATVQSGIDLMLDLVSFPAVLDGATLVITGEGTLDAQTLHGKAPAGVARATAAAVKGEGETGGIPVIAVTGQNALTADQVREAGLTKAYALTDIEPDLDRCVADAGRLVESLSEQVARDWLPAS
ncbi:MAG: glycerate kinase [Streptosporangiaceae bacterium]|nr:glycerate kinase [Streptosporangiaceae bacterium]